MRIVIFSDTHGRINKCIDVVEELSHVDMIIHLGDVMKDADDIAAYFGNIPVLSVPGNCEAVVPKTTDKLIQICGKQIFMTHGHLYNVKNSLTYLADKVKESNADIGLFGHTHHGYCGYVNGVLLLNPGSIALPALDKPSYALMDILSDGKIKTEICTI